MSTMTPKEHIDLHKNTVMLSSLSLYKALWDQQIELVKTFEMKQDEIVCLDESDKEVVKFIREKLGYFIAYSNSPTYWSQIGSDFDYGHLIEALNAFDRLCVYGSDYAGIFNTLRTRASYRLFPLAHVLTTVERL
jgi:type I restriction enzyme M protein